VKLFDESKIDYDMEEMALDTCDGIDDSLRPEEAFRGSQGIKTTDGEKILKYCLIASVFLHIAFFGILPRLAQLTPTKALLQPGERVTQVRLIEPQTPKATVEPPPERASAISDRDHTAQRERLPKMPPAPKAPLGKVEPVEKRMASLAPPPAPEDLVKFREEATKKDAETKTLAPLEKAPDSHLKQRHRIDARSKRNNLKKHSLDLTPTPQDIAAAARGGTEFFPEGDVDEAVVDINTREDRFFSYLLQLKHKIQGVWVYPSVAAKAGIGGALSVEFSISKNGELLYVNLLDSSGHTILDECAMKAIKTAAPYYPFPDRMKAKRLRIRANFIYVTSNYARGIM
jgi:periplasmic protein TonB